MEQSKQNVSDNEEEVIEKENGNYVSEEDEKSGEENPTFGFTEKSWRTDFVLIVEGTKLYVSKTILSLASPVLDAMFQSDFMERSSSELELPGKKLNDVIELLRCIYPNTISQITSCNALCILPLVEEYQVFQLKPRCEAALLESVNEETPIRDLFLLLKHACLYDLKELRERCADLASSASKQQLDEASEKCPLPSEGANEILKRVNNKLRETNAELEKLNKETSAAADKTTTELAIMKQYFSADLKKTKELTFDIGYNWEENITVLVVDMKHTKTKTAELVKLWDISLLISASVVTNGGCDSWLHIAILTLACKLKCFIKARLVLVNRKPEGTNETFIIQEQFHKWNQTIEKNVKKVYEIEDIGNRFLYKGKVGMIVHIFMSEPNKE